MIPADLKTELEALVLQINADVEQSDGYTAQAVGMAGVAIRARTKLGEKLIRAKKIVGHGEWENWLEANCPKLTERSARRYMKLAKGTHVSDLEDCASVTEAYRLAGVLPEREDSEPGDEKKKGDNYVVHVSRALDVLNKAAVDSWQPQDKAQLRARLKPLVDLYDRLA